MTWHDPSKDPIIGETVVAVRLESDGPDHGEELVFVCVGGRYVYTVEGDCCSQSWIEHLTIPPDILGATITGVTAPELPSHDGTTEGAAPGHEHLAIYHTAWQTTKGEVIAEYRNSSNGYYGGWMNAPEVKDELLAH